MNKKRTVVVGTAATLLIGLAATGAVFAWMRGKVHAPEPERTQVARRSPGPAAPAIAEPRKGNGTTASACSKAGDPARRVRVGISGGEASATVPPTGEGGSSAQDNVPRQDDVTVDGVRSFAEAVVRLRQDGACADGQLSVLARKHMGTTCFSDVAAVLCLMVVDGTSGDRMAALAAMAALRHEASGSGATPSEEAAFDPDGAETESPAEFDDGEERATLAIMTACLSDADPDVRDAAYKTLVELPCEERSALSLQVLGNDDAVLKEALLERTREMSDEQSLTINFHGLDAEEPNIRRIAAANILTKTGQTFSSSEEAFDWYERQMSKQAVSNE